MEKNYWLHLIPISRSTAPEPTAKVLLAASEDPKVLLVGTENPHPGGAAPSRGYPTWGSLENALRGIAHVQDDVLQEASKEIKSGKAFTIVEVKLDEQQIRRLGLNFKN